MKIGAAAELTHRVGRLSKRQRRGTCPWMSMETDETPTWERLWGQLWYVMEEVDRVSPRSGPEFGARCRPEFRAQMGAHNSDSDEHGCYRRRHSRGSRHLGISNRSAVAAPAPRTPISSPTPAPSAPLFVRIRSLGAHFGTSCVRCDGCQRMQPHDRALLHTIGSSGRKVRKASHPSRPSLRFRWRLRNLQPQAGAISCLGGGSEQEDGL